MELLHRFLLWDLYYYSFVVMSIIKADLHMIKMRMSADTLHLPARIWLSG